MSEPFICEMCRRLHVNGEVACSEWCEPSNDKIDTIDAVPILIERTWSRKHISVLCVHYSILRKNMHSNAKRGVLSTTVVI